MSSNASCNLLKDVKPFKTGWRVRVKMLHSWKQNFGGETLECILADETGGKIHASCKRSQMFRVQRGLPIGEWRFVENFTVSQAGGQYRPTNLQYKMTISGETVISKSDLQNNNHFLDLASYEDIIEGKLNPYFLIDVIGEIFDMRTIQTVKVKNEDRKRVVFRLRDTNGNDMECCLWGRFTELIESHLQENEGKLIICLIRFAKISYYKGNIQITNAFDASLVTLNPEMQEAVDFKERLLQALLPLAIVENKPAYKAVKQQAEDWDDVQVCSISEILVAVEIHKIESQTAPVSLIESGSSIFSAGEVSKFDPNSQNSAEDVTTPFSKRKDNDDLPDVTSASKKLCTDTIKPEKTKTE
ncbi:hypothetical protein HID58_066150 [Brassica napus]|uniref:Replication protein A 70 kDa DNA-binding subunit B/D first OB fold domain-containing protein n=1 Tax=Brassica napus TaxID=3708 RepID=A0ABQ7ZEX2_BRANA|nr:hypothetical protein HID58_066150 [Brassica napus]